MQELDIVWFDLDNDRSVPAIVLKDNGDHNLNLMVIYGGNNEIIRDVPRRGLSSPDPRGHTWRPKGTS